LFSSAEFGLTLLFSLSTLALQYFGGCCSYLGCSEPSPVHRSPALSLFLEFKEGKNTLRGHGGVTRRVKGSNANGQLALGGKITNP
jgi:hypothetical protein